MDRHLISYVLDSENRIQRIGGSFDVFGRENGLTSRVVGRPIWEFISGREVTEIYKLLLAQVRRTGVAVTFPFRCDSPDTKRSLQMRIIPLADNAAEFQTSVVHQETREAVRFLDRTETSRLGLLRICSWCCKALVGNRWVEAEEAAQTLRLLADAPVPQLTHGMCDECFENARSSIVHAPDPTTGTHTHPLRETE